MPPPITWLRNLHGLRVSPETLRLLEGAMTPAEGEVRLPGVDWSPQARIQVEIPRETLPPQLAPEALAAGRELEFRPREDPLAPLGEDMRGRVLRAKLAGDAIGKLGPRVEPPPTADSLEVLSRFGFAPLQGQQGLPGALGFQGELLPGSEFRSPSGKSYEQERLAALPEEAPAGPPLPDELIRLDLLLLESTKAPFGELTGFRDRAGSVLDPEADALAAQTGEIAQPLRGRLSPPPRRVKDWSKDTNKRLQGPVGQDEISRLAELGVLPFGRPEAVPGLDYDETGLLRKTPSGEQVAQARQEGAEALLVPGMPPLERQALERGRISGVRVAYPELLEGKMPPEAQVTPETPRVPPGGADAVIAVSAITPDGRSVDGGTGWAVAMAQELGLPIYVFDHKFRPDRPGGNTGKVIGTAQWHRWDPAQERFVPSDPPTWSKRPAVIGSRHLTREGTQAIGSLAKLLDAEGVARPERAFSGGASGADRTWAAVLRKRGIDVREFRPEELAGLPPAALDRIAAMVQTAAKRLGKHAPTDPRAKDLIHRDALQILGEDWAKEGGGAPPSPPPPPSGAPVHFVSTSPGPERILSNFAPTPVMLDGVQYPTVEHAYQAAKFPHHQREAIRRAATPAAARSLGRQLSAKIRRDWDAVKEQVMRDLLQQKFAPGTAAHTFLVSTGTRPLLHTNTFGDRVWGVDPQGVGENRLGRILEDLRRSPTGEEPPTQGASPSPPTIAATHPQNLKMPAAANIWGRDTTTFAEGKAGNRSGTTKSWGRDLPKVGQVLRFTDGKDSFLVQVTEIIPIGPKQAADPAFVAEWSRIEGWTPEHFRTRWETDWKQRSGPVHQVRFKLVEDGGGGGWDTPPPSTPPSRPLRIYDAQTGEAGELTPAAIETYRPREAMGAAEALGISGQQAAREMQLAPEEALTIARTRTGFQGGKPDVGQGRLIQGVLPEDPEAAVGVRMIVPEGSPFAAHPRALVIPRVVSGDPLSEAQARALPRVRKDREEDGVPPAWTVQRIPLAQRAETEAPKRPFDPERDLDAVLNQLGKDEAVTADLAGIEKVFGKKTAQALQRRLESLQRREDPPDPDAVPLSGSAQIILDPDSAPLAGRAQLQTSLPATQDRHQHQATAIKQADLVVVYSGGALESQQRHLPKHEADKRAKLQSEHLRQIMGKELPSSARPGANRFFFHKARTAYWAARKAGKPVLLNPSREALADALADGQRVYVVVEGASDPGRIAALRERVMREERGELSPRDLDQRVREELIRERLAQVRDAQLLAARAGDAALTPIGRARLDAEPLLRTAEEKALKDGDPKLRELRAASRASLKAIFSEWGPTWQREGFEISGKPEEVRAGVVVVARHPDGRAIALHRNKAGEIVHSELPSDYGTKVAPWTGPPPKLPTGTKFLGGIITLPDGRRVIGISDDSRVVVELGPKGEIRAKTLLSDHFSSKETKIRQRVTMRSGRQDPEAPKTTQGNISRRFTSPLWGHSRLEIGEEVLTPAGPGRVVHLPAKSTEVIVELHGSGVQKGPRPDAQTIRLPRLAVAHAASAPPPRPRVETTAPYPRFAGEGRGPGGTHDTSWVSPGVQRADQPLDVVPPPSIGESVLPGTITGVGDLPRELGLQELIARGVQKAIKDAEAEGADPTLALEVLRKRLEAEVDLPPARFQEALAQGVRAAGLAADQRTQRWVRGLWEQIHREGAARDQASLPWNQLTEEEKLAVRARDEEARGPQAPPPAPEDPSLIREALADADLRRQGLDPDEPISRARARGALLSAPLVAAALGGESQEQNEETPLQQAGFFKPAQLRPSGTPPSFEAAQARRLAPPPRRAPMAVSPTDTTGDVLRRELKTLALDEMALPNEFVSRPEVAHEGAIIRGGRGGHAEVLFHEADLGRKAAEQAGVLPFAEEILDVERSLFQWQQWQQRLDAAALRERTGLTPRERAEARAELTEILDLMRAGAISQGGLTRDQLEVRLGELEAQVGALDPAQQAAIAQARDSYRQLGERIFQEIEPLLDPALADRLRANGYMPGHRMLDEIRGSLLSARGPEALGVGSKLGLTKDKIVKALEGSDLPMKDPWEDARITLELAVKERAVNDLSRLYLEDFAGSGVGRRLAPEEAPRPGETELSYVEAGKPIRFAVPQAIGDVMQLVHVEQITPIMNAVRRMGFDLASASQLSRDLIASANPGFALKQLPLDFMAAVAGPQYQTPLRSRLGPMFRDFLRLLKEEFEIAWDKREWTAGHREFLESGAGFSGISHLGRAEGAHLSTAGRLGGLRQLVNLTQGVSDRILQPVENSIKRTALNQLRREGALSPVEQVWQTRALAGTPDLAVRGTLGRNPVVNAFTIFLNPQIQGIRQGIQIYSQDGGEKFVRHLAGFAAAYAALQGWNQLVAGQDTSDFSRDEQRDNLVIFVPGVRERLPDGRERPGAIKLPIPMFLRGFIQPVMALLDAASGRISSGQAALDFVNPWLPGGAALKADRLGESAADRGVSLLQPAFRWPAEAFFTGRDAYTGAPIVGARAERLVTPMEYTAATSPLARRIGQAGEALGVPISPDRADHFLRSFTPGLAEILLRGPLDAVAGIGLKPEITNSQEALGPLPVSSQTLRQTALVGPFARAFLPSPISQRAKDAREQLSKRGKEAQEARSSVNRALERVQLTGSPEALAEYQKRVKELGAKAEQNRGLSRVQRELAELGRQREALRLYGGDARVLEALTRREQQLLGVGR